MVSRFAYHSHRINKHPFSRTYYKTKRQIAEVGDSLYVISGNGTDFFLEGRYRIAEVGSPDEKGLSTLLLKDEMRGRNALPIGQELWFNQQECRNLFASGQSLNPVRPEYIKWFDQMLDPTVVSVTFDDAMDDLAPEQSSGSFVSAFRFKRSPVVRAHVLSRANGRCEFCGQPGFLRADGTHYLESHHIIKLASDGEDRLTNVIALCANHHREAHYSNQTTALEEKMIEIVSAKQQSR